VRHLLFKTPLLAPGAKEDEQAVAGVRAKAEGVLKELKAAEISRSSRKNIPKIRPATRVGRAWLAGTRTRRRA